MSVLQQAAILQVQLVLVMGFGYLDPCLLYLVIYYGCYLSIISLFSKKSDCVELIAFFVVTTYIALCTSNLFMLDNNPDFMGSLW